MTNTAKPKKKPAPKPAVDWMALRNQFVYGIFDERGSRVSLDLQQVAAAHGLSYQTVRGVARRGNRSVPGDWSGDRLRAQQRLAETLDAKRADKAADAIIEMEARHLRTWAAMEASCVKKLYVVTNGVVAGFNPSLPVSDARALCEMLKTATSAQRVILGMPETRIGVHEDGDEESERLKALSDDEVAAMAGQFARAITVDRNKRRLPQ